jgi:hypothetical protein
MAMASPGSSRAQLVADDTHLHQQYAGEKELATEQMEAPPPQQRQQRAQQL